MEKTIKICKVKFDKDYYMKYKDASPIAEVVCDNKSIGTIELGYYGFNLYNTIKTVPVHSIFINAFVDLYDTVDTSTLKQIMYNAVLAAIHRFEIDMNSKDDCVYLVNTEEVIPHYVKDRDFSIGAFIDACYAYIPNIVRTGKEYYNKEVTRYKSIIKPYKYEEEIYNEYEEEDNPAYCKPDDPDKELNARYE